MTEITHNEIPFNILEHIMVINQDWIEENNFTSGNIKYHTDTKDFSQLTGYKFSYNRGIYFMRTSEESMFNLDVYGRELTDYQYLLKFEQVQHLANELKQNYNNIEYLHLIWKRPFGTNPLNTLRVFECLMCNSLNVPYEQTKLELKFYTGVYDCDSLDLFIHKEINGVELDRIYIDIVSTSAFKHHYIIHIIGSIEELTKILLLDNSKVLKELMSTDLFRLKIPDLQII